MSKNREGRINDEVRAALSDALRELKDPRVSAGLISILRCEVTGDQRYCKVYTSVLGTDEQQADAIKGLRSASGWLRREMGRRVGLRYTPELIIVPDDSIERGAHISRILNEVIPASGESAKENDVNEPDTDR